MPCCSKQNKHNQSIFFPFIEKNGKKWWTLVNRKIDKIEIVHVNRLVKYKVNIYKYVQNISPRNFRHKWIMGNILLPRTNYFIGQY
jgi:hypothetical protein